MAYQEKLFHKTFSIPLEILELQHDSIEQSKHIANKSDKKLGNFATLLTTWFDFAYFFAICPFHFKHEGSKNGYKIIRHKIQNIICGLGHISTLMEYLSDVRGLRREISPSGRNPVVYLEYFMVHASIIRHFLLVVIYWRRSELFHKIVNSLDGRQPMTFKCFSSTIENHKLKSQVPKKWIAVIITSIYFFLALFTSITPFFYALSNKPEEFERMEKMVKFMYFVPEKGSQVQARHSPVVLTYSPLLSNTMHINDSDIPDYIMGFGTDAMIPDQIHQKYQPNIPCVTFGIVAVIFRYLFGCSADCLILIIVLSLWFPVADFAKFIRIERRMTKSILTPADAFVEYRSLKRLANLINATIRNLIIFVILQAIFFYPVGIKQVVASCDSSGVHYIGFFLLSFCITFYFAADICKQMQSFQAYLRDEHRQWEFAKLDRYMILQETVTNPIGIADEGRFTVDFPFVAAVTSTLMTYFIVSVQYDDKHKS